jgi:integrase
MAVSEGQVIERRWKSGRGYALRFVAYGKRRYLTLGMAADGWTPQRAETELANVLADVRRGIWIPPATKTKTPETTGPSGPGEITFHAFAADWIASRHGAVSPRTVEYEQWALERHLLPFFAHHALGDIDIPTVDAYRQHKLDINERRRTAIQRGRPMLDTRDRPLKPIAASTINKSIDVLQAILAVAIEYGHITTNPAIGRRRRLKPPPRRPIHLDTLVHIQALLDAAAALDANPRSTIRDRLPQVATLMFAGPRAHEHAALTWRDIDLANHRLHIRRSKTQAGLRDITIQPILARILRDHRRTSTHTGPDDPVFPTVTGGIRDKDNVRNRVLQPILRAADAQLARGGLPPLPGGLTPHKLRHTYASILVAIGEDPASAMHQLGHTDPHFTLRTYTHLMRRDPTERQALRNLINDAQDETE